MYRVYSIEYRVKKTKERIEKNQQDKKDKSKCRKKGQTALYIFLLLMLYKKLPVPFFSQRIEGSLLGCGYKFQLTKYCTCFNF